jgi:hypothetical protein
LGRIEQLEDRRLLYGGPGPTQVSPLGLVTGKFADQAAYDRYYDAVVKYEAYVSSQNSGNNGHGPVYPPGYGSMNGEGLSQPVVVTELEPNNANGSGQLLAISSTDPDHNVALIVGSLANDPNNTDLDHYTMNLRGGDIFDISSNGPAVELLDSQGNLLVTATTNPVLATGDNPYPENSPLSTTGSVAFAYVIPTDGVYQIRVSGGIGPYEATVKLFRPVIEQQPLGTVPELFLDFDGAVVDRSEFDAAGNGTIAMPSLAASLAPYGYSASDVNQLIDKIIAMVNEDFNGSIPQLGANGFYFNDGVPGNYALRITNSRDHGERFGLPNVTRVVISSTSEFFYGDPALGGVLGVAPNIDMGNFDLEQTVMLFAESYQTSGIPQSMQLGPSASASDALAILVAGTISHELGHAIGLWHKDFFDNSVTIMDPFDNPDYIVGADGLLGTADDGDIDFVPNVYRRTDGVEFLTGRENDGATVSHVLGTGTRSAFVKGTVFNDLNQSGTKNSQEPGMAGQVVFADINGNGILDSSESRTTTAGDGSYTLAAPIGKYFIRTVPAPSFRVTNNGFEVTLVLDQTVQNVDLGQFVASQGITGYKWADLNGNGEREDNEPGIAGFYIYADLDGDNRPDLAEPGTYTLADGSYVLNAPLTGVYAIREVVSPGYVQTFPLNEEQEHVITPATPRPLRGINFGNQPSRDWGDLPQPYKTTAADGGANHGIVPGFSLGSLIDPESDGTPDIQARGDDLAGTDDEDGISLLAPLVVGASNNQIRVAVTNTMGAAGYLQGWMDFNGDGDFNDAGEHIINDQSAISGTYTFTIPAGSIVGNVLARFRLSGVKGVGSSGATPMGEVEDYQFQTLSELRYTLPDSYRAARNSVLADNVIDVLGNDPITKVEGFSAAISSVSQGSRGGTVTTDGKTVSYQPANGFVGTEVFRYTILASNGVVSTETVTVSVDFFFDNPQAIDNSFNVSANSTNLQLDVLANDVEGQGGAIQIQSVSAPNSGGTAVPSANNRHIIYTPAPQFEGTETFTYTIIDSTGATSTATVTIHVLPGDYQNDDVEFSLTYTDLNGAPISQIVQGNPFLVEVYVRDVRANPGANPGVFAAYLDLLYNSDLVLPAPPTGGSFDFNVQFANPYTLLQTGDSELPGIIDELGATSSNSADRNGRIKLATLRFDARTAGIATFFPDPADQSPASDVILNNNSSQAVPEIRTRYVPSSLEVIANPVEFPQAVDDSPIDSVPTNSTNTFDVLANDVVGINGPIRIVRVTQPSSGTVSIDRSSGTDMIRFVSGSTASTQSFTYTIIDSIGFESTATVTVQVGNQTADDQIRLRLEITDLAGNPITQIGVNQQFQLRGYVDDLRVGVTDPGVFAAFQDILLSNPDLASINLASNPRGFAVQFSNNYNDATSGDIRIPGIINEIGSQQSNSISTPLGDGEFLQFTITLTARQAGALTFAGDPADLLPNSDSLLYNLLAPVDKSRIAYTDATITIVGSSGTGAGEGNTNETNPLDVNNDGYVSSIDVLALINRINAIGRGAFSTMQAEGESAPQQPKKYYYDTNNDGSLSSLDILKIINYLNEKSRRGEGEGESSRAPSQDAALASMSADDFDSVLAAAAVDVDAIKKGGTRV